MIARGAILLVAGLLLAGCGGKTAAAVAEAAATSSSSRAPLRALDAHDQGRRHGEFENESGDDFWPASNVHPTHLLYPGFDAKKPILDGGSYSFTFTKPAAGATTTTSSRTSRARSSSSRAGVQHGGEGCGN